MSKSKGNALSPIDLIQEFGADALRWALLADSSPWNNKRFSKKTVSQAKSKVLDTLLNVYSFYQMYAKIDGFQPEKDSAGNPTTLDKWVLSRLNSVIQEVTESLDAYDITKGARALSLFIDELSNWYVRRSRQRFWSKGMTEDKRAGFHTLFEVLTKLAQLMAPYTPFVTEEIYTDLTGSSVHLSDYPTSDLTQIDTALEKDMATVLQIIEQGRSLRNEAGIKTKQPLSHLVVMPKEDVNLSELENYKSIIQEELNVKDVSWKQLDNQFIQLAFKLNFSVAGPKVGKAVGELKKKVEALSAAEKEKFIADKEYTFTLQSGETISLTTEDVLIEKTGKDGFILIEGNTFMTLLDIRLTEALKEEGFVREFVRAVQAYRKELNLPVEQRVQLFVYTDETLQSILTKFDKLVHQHLILDSIQFEEKADMKFVKVEGHETGLFIQS